MSNGITVCSLCAVSSHISETVEDLFFGIDGHTLGHCYYAREIFVWLDHFEGYKTGEKAFFKTIV